MATKAQLIGLYVEADDEVSRIERELIAPLKRRMAEIKTLMKTKMLEDGEQSSNTPNGTAYFSETDSASIADATVFMEFVLEQQAWDLLEKRAAKLAVRSYIEEHQVPPPGVNYGTKREVNIRRPTAK